jgi:WD40 repeat protein/serine/threonine protein kinase
MDTFAGQQIKGYELQERIAAGGFGAVYRAWQSTIGREVAIKVILPSLANKPDFIRRFECEAQIIARLEHMNIVPLYDYWRDPDGAYLVMRYLRGGSLHQYLRTQGKFDIEEAFNILAQVAQGLQVAHRNQIIHRDIKPGNILLDEDGNGYLGDFGIAKDYNATQNITEADNMVGSPEYLAPEQALSEAVTAQTDIYSLGVVLYEMLTGEHPFSGVDKVTFIYKHLSEPLPQVMTLDDKISDDVNDVIQKATAKDPNQRFKTVLDMIEVLRQAAQLDAPPTPISLVELLTPREQEVMQLIIDNKTNREIAHILVLTEGTVKQYITSIYRKLKVRSRVQAITRARDLNFVVKKPQVVVTTGHLPEPENPYKGLRAFQPADAQTFFGREKLTQKLLHRLQEQVEYQRFLPVVGPSGSGKSSVVRAGLIPALWRGDIAGSENWYVIDMIPGTNPIDELEVALFQIATDKSMNLRAQLERDKRGLLRVANMILPDDKSELLVIIDQFEEVFTLMQNEDERLHFLGLLIEAVTDKRSRVRVIVTLRADYYDRPLQYPEFGELIRSRVETVLPLSADELERAISEPAHREGVTFEDGLVSRIVSDVHYQPGALPLLQYALTELFERRDGRKLTFEAYQAIGGTGGALANRADEIYLEADDTGREHIRQMFLRLVTLGEGAEDTRRRVRRSELLQITLDSEQMDEIIDLYATSRLLSLDNDPATRQPTIEVAHEAILREWDRLRQWLNESREDIRQQRLVAQAAEAWTVNQRDKSYLLTGTRLEQVEKWRDISQLALTPLENEYIQTSVHVAKAQEIAETERQKHEKKLERRSIIFLRTLVAVLTVAVLGAFGLTTVAVKNANKAHNNFITAERVRLAAQARVLLDSGESTELVALLALRSLSLDYSPEADQALLQAYSSGFPIFSYQHTAIISSNSGIISNDGSNHFLVGTNDNKILMWNLQTGQMDRVFSGHREWVIAVALTSDGQRMVSSSGDGTVRVWDIASWETLFALPNHGGPVWTVVLTPDEHTIITGDINGVVRLWDYETQALLSEFQAHNTYISDMMLTRNGQRILTSSCDNTVRLWDLATETEIMRYQGHEGCVRTFSLTPDGNFLVTGSYDNTARLWDVETGQELMQYRGHADSVESVDVSPDGRYLITGSWDRSARLWDITTGETLRIFRGQPDIYGIARFTANGKQIVISSFNRIELWNLETSVEPVLMRPPYIAHTSDSILIQFVNDAEQLLTVSATGVVRIWDTEGSHQELSTHSLDMPLSLDAVFLEDKQQIVSATSEGRIQIWNLESGQLLHEFNDPLGQVQHIAANADKSLLATIGGNDNLRLWDLKTGELIRDFVGHDAEIRSVAFSSDGRYIITGSVDASAKIWDVASGTLLHTLNGHTDSIVAVAISSDSQYVLTGSDDTFVILWNLHTGEQIRRFAGLNAAIGVVAFSPDHQFVFGGASNGVAMLWDTESATSVRQFTGQLSSIAEIDFSDDGNRLATSDVTSNYLWRTSLDEIIATVCDQLRRDFTPEERITYSIPDDEATCPEKVNTEVAIQATWTPFPTIAPEAIAPIQITPQVGLNTSSANQASASVQTQPIFWFATGFPIESGSATLTRTSGGIAMTYHARELTPGDAITIWWVIWERPQLCTLPACTPDDVFLTDAAGNLLTDENDYLMLNQTQIDKVGISLLYATGNVVNNDGTADFTAYLPVGNRTGRTTFGRGLLFPFTPEIHLVARTHGTASTDRSILHQQLNTDWGGCEPFHLPCNDVQAAVFPPVNP